MQLLRANCFWGGRKDGCSRLLRGGNSYVLVDARFVVRFGNPCSAAPRSGPVVESFFHSRWLMPFLVSVSVSLSVSLLVSLVGANEDVSVNVDFGVDLDVHLIYRRSKSRIAKQRVIERGKHASISRSSQIIPTAEAAPNLN